MASIQTNELRIDNIVDRLYGKVFGIEPAAPHSQIIFTHLTEKWMGHEHCALRDPYLMPEDLRRKSSPAEKGKQSELIATLYGQSYTMPPKRDSMSRRRDLIELIISRRENGNSQVIQDMISANVRWITDRIGILSREEQMKKLELMRAVFLDYLEQIPQTEQQIREECSAGSGDNIDSLVLMELLRYVRHQFYPEFRDIHTRIVANATGLTWLFLAAALRKAMNSSWEKMQQFLVRCPDVETRLPEAPMSAPIAEVQSNCSSKDFDIHQSLLKKFDTLYANPKEPEYRLDLDQEWLKEMDRQDASDLLSFQASRSAEMIDIGNKATEQEENGETGIQGKYFSLVTPVGKYPIIYQIDRMALPERRKWIFATERLDCAIELLENHELRFTFFVDHPAPDGNHLIYMNFGEETVYIHSAFMDYNCIKIGLNSAAIRLGSHSATECEILHAFNNHAMLNPSVFHLSEDHEYSYSVDPEHPIVILNSSTTEEVKPELYRENGILKGRLFLKSNTEYLCFRIYSNHSASAHTLSDYDLGKAYKNGTMKLNKDYEKAHKYLKLAAAAKDARAFDELAELYDKGLGCIQNPKRAKQLRLDAQVLKSSNDP